MILCYYRNINIFSSILLLSILLFIKFLSILEAFEDDLRQIRTEFYIKNFKVENNSICISSYTSMSIKVHICLSMYNFIN